MFTQPQKFGNLLETQAELTAAYSVAEMQTPLFENPVEH
jgi:hypothetical protein